MIDDSDIEYDWGYQVTNGMHTNGPEYRTLKATHEPSGISVFLPWSRNTLHQKSVAMEMIEWALEDSKWQR